VNKAPEIFIAGTITEVKQGWARSQEWFYEAQCLFPQYPT